MNPSMPSVDTKPISVERLIDHIGTIARTIVFARGLLSVTKG